MFWQELAAVPILAAIGWWLAGRAGRRWGFVFTAALLVVAAVIVARRLPQSTAVPAFRIVNDARVNPLVMALVIPLSLGVLMRRMDRGRQRGAVGIMMAALLVNFSILPGAMPLLARVFLLSTPTLIDDRGVCHQTHDFTCGPASMVTCLATLGIRAEESDIARLSRCGPAVGTDPEVLAEAVSGFNVHGAYRTLTHAAHLRTPAVVELAASCGWGHYVAAMERSHGLLLIGDPDAPAGLNCAWVSEADLEADWTGRVIEVQRP